MIANKHQANIQVIDFSTLAYSKLVLHALRYPSSFVGGYLIGNKNTLAFTISDVVPLHHEIPVGPLLEASAEAIESQIQAPNKIIGYYFGQEESSNTESGKYPRFVDNLKERIKANSGHCIILEIKGDLLAKKDTPCVQTEGLYTVATLEGFKKSSKVLDVMIEQGQQYRISDFEDYLNSTGASPADYFNNYLAEVLSIIPFPAR